MDKTDKALPTHPHRTQEISPDIGEDGAGYIPHGTNLCVGVEPKLRFKAATA